MKKVSLLFAGIFFLLLSLSANAQTKTGADFFEGKWSVLAKGLPDGDRKMNFVLEKKEATLTGSLLDSTGKEITKLTSVDLKDKTATLYFTSQGYDVNLEMTKKDEDHVTGSLMGMFDAEGDRVKATK
jgi:hypothetical protein